MTLQLNTLEINQNIFGQRNTAAVATTTDLDNVGNGTWVYSDPTLTAGTAGTTTIDGYTLADGDRVLVKNQVTGVENGVYEASDTGVGDETVLTRVEDLYIGDSANGYQIWSRRGTVNRGLGFICTAVVGSDVIGTDDPGFTQYDVTQTLAVARGGTSATSFTTNGVLYGNGTNAIQATASANSSVLITSGGGTPSLATTLPSGLTVPGVLLTSTPTLYTPRIIDSGLDHYYNIAVNDLAADRTITLPLLAGNDTFVFEAFGQTLTNKTITSPVINAVTADFTEEILIFADVASAVNEITITNAATGGSPTISTTGDDANVSMALVSKGTGVFTFDAGSAAAPAEIRLLDNTGGEYVGLDVPGTVTASYTLTFPAAVGTTGQVLRLADNSGNLQFASVTSHIEYDITSQNYVANSTNPANSVFAYFAWDNSQYGSGGYNITSILMIFWYQTSSNRNLTLDAYDGTSVIGTITVPAATATGIQTFSVTPPTSDVLISFRAYKTSGGGQNPQIFGLQAEMS